jgi:hypothetical protein
MVFDRYHFHFFGNREITSLYLTLGLLHFGESLIQVFVPIYFWGLGFSIAEILLFYFLKSLFFVLLVVALLPLMRNLSDKMMIFLSIPLTILYFFGLNFIQEFPILFFIIPVIHALGFLLFNVGYHIDFSNALDRGHIGREVGTRYLVVALFQFIAPFVGGVLIGVYGFHLTFVVATAVLLLAVLPLFFFPRRMLSPHLSIKKVVAYLTNKSLAPFTVGSIGYANEIIVGRIIWPLFIFLGIGSIEYFGGIISLGLFAGAIATYLAGFLSDAGKRRKVLGWAAGVVAFVWALRPYALGSLTIIGSHIGGHIAHTVFMVARSSQYYAIAQKIPAPGIFILSQEVLYHLARILFLPILIALSLVLTRDAFFTASFLLASSMALLFLFANKFHLRNLKV